VEGQVKIFTDGGCSGNPGPGGWAYVIVLETPQGAKIAARDMGAERETTNNRMELAAVIEALRAFKAMEGVPRRARVCTDSQYVQKGISEWINQWKRNGWKTSGKKPVKNTDLWMELDALAAALSPGWEWVRGHAGNEYNELCDSMTQEAISSIAVKSFF
jgi:ribonuclease HI